MNCLRPSPNNHATTGRAAALDLMTPPMHAPIATTTDRRPRRLARWGLPLLVLLAGLVAVLSLLGSGDGQQPEARLDESEWFTVRRGSFDLLVVAAGELEAKRQVELKCGVKQSTSIVEIVAEGSRVEAGQVLVRLDDTAVRQKLEQVQLDVENARAEKKSAEENLAIEQNEADATERAAKVKLSLAELALAQWREGDVPQKRRELKLALDTAQRTLTRARRDLELSQQLYEEKFISLGELEDDQIKLIEAENAVATAELAVRVYEQFTLPKDQQQFESDVAQARAELSRTVQQNQSKLSQAEANLNSRAKALLIREQQLKDLEEELAATVIRAPQAGLVVYASSVGDIRRRGDPMGVGRQVRFAETIIVLPDTSRMVASLRVHEARLPQVEPGQHVTVTIDARPGSAIDGVVASIGVMAESGGWFNPDLREYTVKVDLPGQTDPTLKPSMRASGQIRVGRVDDALFVPVQAIFTEGETRFVHVPAGPGRVQRQPVTIGRANDTLVEITGGLSDGDRVMLRQPRPGEIVRG